jgi:carboxylesterase type B
MEPNPATTEDCLFLDVTVPASVLENANNRYRKRQDWSDHRGGAKVLVWIYGGGYTLGTKDTADGTGLIQRSQEEDGQGLIFVALNYRLGAMGWLSGSSLQAAGGVSNAALYDQRLALEWVAKNIHLFGGDSTQITVMGESAGGS